MKTFSLPALLSFNGGFVDTAGFLGLQGLFTAHVNGNFVTLAATLVMGTHGVIAKLIALPEFIVIVAVARVAGWRCVRATSRLCRSCSSQRSVFCSRSSFLPSRSVRSPTATRLRRCLLDLPA